MDPVEPLERSSLELRVERPRPGAPPSRRRPQERERRQRDRQQGERGQERGEETPTERPSLDVRA